MTKNSAPKSKKVLVFIVTYNAEKTIASVLNRIPEEVFKSEQYKTDILIIDDGSKDSTFDHGVDYKSKYPQYPLTVLRNPINLGYGGNQKVGYHYAIKHGYDIVVLLHGDGQYAPEQLPKLLQPLVSGEADAVFGSRMMEGDRALKGGMPLYKYFGNKVLTYLENKLVGTKLSEWHSGYRLYSVAALKRLPFERNPNGFSFDTDIIIQLSAAGCRIKEISIPTFYGDEICHVNGLQYAREIVWSCFLYKLQGFGIFYDPKFDIESGNVHYVSKFDFLSSHSIALDSVGPEDKCLIVGCGPANLVTPFVQRAKAVSAIDQTLDPELKKSCEDVWEADLDRFEIAKETKGKRFSKIFALDVIEHLKSPEKFLEDLRAAPASFGSEVIITVPNVGFYPVRLMLLLGSFNYGKRGILDRTHMRLFTRKSLTRIMEQAGYQIVEFRGVPGPYPLALGRNWFSNLLLQLNNFVCKFLPGLASYQLFVRARPNPTVEKLFEDAITHSEERVSKRNSQVNGQLEDRI